MNWSISGSQMFKQCPRKWFYSSIVSKNPKDSLQHETKILKNLQSIYAWRGKLVDDVISFYAIPKLNKKEKLYEQNLVDYGIDKARKEFNEILNNDDEKVSPFIELENFGKIDNQIIETLFSEIEISLRNFTRSQFIKEFYETGLQIYPQRNLHFKNDYVHVYCRLDAICVYESKPPIIVDWKVKTNSYLDHKKQLATYAYVLSKTSPHKGMEKLWENYFTKPTELELLEFQLLHGRERYYSFSKEDLLDIEDFIFESANSMLQLLDNRKYPSILPKDVPTTSYPSNCERCQFKRVCWRE